MLVSVAVVKAVQFQYHLNYSPNLRIVLIKLTISVHVEQSSITQAQQS